MVAGWCGARARTPEVTANDVMIPIRSVVALPLDAVLDRATMQELLLEVRPVEMTWRIRIWSLNHYDVTATMQELLLEVGRSVGRSCVERTDVAARTEESRPFTAPLHTPLGSQ